MAVYKIQIKGHVQGVGFRPFIYKLAKLLSLCGCVYNDHQGVWIFCECEETQLQNFIVKIQAEKPSASSIEEILVSISTAPLDYSIYAKDTAPLDCAHYTEHSAYSNKKFKDFLIVDSQGIYESPTASVLPDLKTCEECLVELNNPSDRRYQYPFINCTQCGPRFSIIGSLPYDRMRTTMSDFVMCDDCQVEYLDPNSRRFHAEPIACSKCGPHLELWDSKGEVLSLHNIALNSAVHALKEGKILALKGVGGFQLLVRAKDFEALVRLRKRKQRPTKAFAVMVKNIEMAKVYANLFIDENNLQGIYSETEVEVPSFTESKLSSLNMGAAERELCSAAAPIVLVSDRGLLATNVNPNNPYLGIMIATSPLHYLLLDKMNEALVVTSGNLSEEPLCIDNQEALDRLGNIADFFLVHNRRIERPVDDSVIQIIENQRMILRRARGYAPSVFTFKTSLDNINLGGSESSCKKILAVGAHLKNTFAFKDADRIYLSQHIGDLEALSTQEFCLREIKAFQKFYNIQLELILHDLHPDYASTKMAQENFSSLKQNAVQHHEAHAWAGIFECALATSDVCIAIWDGAGFGYDGTVWGGEFFIHRANIKRLEHRGTTEQFRLLGGAIAVKEPWRVLLSLLFQYQDIQVVKKNIKLLKIPVSDSELLILNKLWTTGLNSPKSSSMGRIFDAFSCLLGIININQFEAEAAMQMQFAAEAAVPRWKSRQIVAGKTITSEGSGQFTSAMRPQWNLNLQGDGSENSVLSFQQPLDYILKQIQNEDGPLAPLQKKQLALEFHQGLVLALLEWVEKCGFKKLLVGGGVFQNRLLLKLIRQSCKNKQIEFFFSKEVPINDGGISLGQLVSYHKADSTSLRPQPTVFSRQSSTFE